MRKYNQQTKLQFSIGKWEKVKKQGLYLLSHCCLQVRYLHDFAERLELNVLFQNEITEITRDQNGMFQLWNQNGTSYACRVVIIRQEWQIGC